MSTAWKIRILAPVLGSLSFHCVGVKAADTAIDLFAEQQDFNIPAQSLGTALKQLAGRAGIQILFEEQIVRGLRAPELKTHETLLMALQDLLEGTGLEFSARNQTVAVRKRPFAATTPPGNPALADRDTPRPPPDSRPTGSMNLNSAESMTNNSNGETTMTGKPLLARMASVLAAAFAVGANAQPAAPAPGDQQLSEVVVTGSRVITNGNDSPTPVTVVTTEDLLRAQPGTISAALQNLPVFDSSQGQTGATGGGNQTGSNGSANGPNIRNLGLYRALVLYDGHRIPPTGNTGFVTTDMIPQMLLQRVDVVTGGASAVYGSNAVSGVVNFVTDTHFNGLKFEAQGGISQAHDDRTVDIGSAFGTNLFGGKGHFEASLEYINDPGVLDPLKRKFARNLYATLGSVPGSTAAAGTAANPFKLYSNVRNATSSFGGRINNGPLSGQQFAADGVLSPFTPGVLTGTGNSQVGGDGSYNFNTSVKTALRTVQGFARLDYEFSGGIHGYVEATGTHNRNEYNNNSIALNNVRLSAVNAFLPAVYQAQMPATSTFTFSKISQQFPPTNAYYLTKQYFMLAGLDGKLGDKFRWEASFAHSATSQEQHNAHNVNFQHLYAALDAVKDSSGQVVCSVALTNPGLNPGCVPLNLFGPTASSQAAINYITDNTQFLPYNALDDFSASISGAPISSWAGPVNMALSTDLRRSRAHARSTAQPTELADCTGIRNGNCTQGDTGLHQSGFATTTEVSQTAKELAYEFDAPVLKDVTAAKGVNVNGAVRYTNYDTTGSVTTWKLGLTWHVNDSLTVRAAKSRDIRAPNTFDLFWPVSLTRGNQTDQLTGATLLNVGDLGGSNPNLKPEIGSTTTAGFIFQPGRLPGFSLSLDAYRIRIKDALYEVTATSAQVQRGCIASGGSSNYCQQIVRPIDCCFTTSTANNATLFKSGPINIASIETYGADLEVNYATSLRGHRLSVRGLVTYQPHLTIITPGLTNIDMGGAALGGGQGVGATPALRLATFVNYSPVDNFTVSVLERWRSPLKWNGDSSQVYTDSRIASMATTNLNLAYKLAGNRAKTEFSFNIQNLFDTDPPPSTGGRVNIDPYLGRYYTLGVRIGL